MSALVQKFGRLLALPDHLNFDPQREAQTRNGVVVEGKWWIINPLTDVVIGDGKLNHAPKNFALMWDSFRAGLYQSGLQTGDPTTTFRTYNGTAGLRVDITLPEHDFNHALGDASCLKIRYVDSHDQSSRLSIRAMVMVFWSMNGQISMRDNTSLNYLHTNFVNSEPIAKVASTWHEYLLKDCADMRRMKGIRVSREKAIHFYSTYVASSSTLTGPVVNKAMLDRIMGIHDSYSDLHDTVFRMYNVLTHMSTHVESKSCATKKQLVMEDKISSIIKGDAFKELVHDYGTPSVQ